MRIAVFHELHQGGARRSVREFSKNLIKKGHTLDLYYSDEARNKSEEEIFDHSYFYQFKAKKWTGQNFSAKLYKDTIELIKLSLLHKKIAKVIDSKKYDLVFIEPSRFTQAPFILSFLKSRVVYYAQESLRMVYEDIFAIDNTLPFHKKTYEKINRFIRKQIDRANLSHVSNLLANSRYTSSQIKKAYNKNATVQYMGVDPKTFYPEVAKKDIDILFVGAYQKEEGYGLLKNALEEFNKSIKVVALASERQWIKNDDELRRLYNRAKLIVCLSINEPFGLIPLEAMSCGVPVLAINQGGYKESIIDKKTGKLIQRNEKDLTDGLKYLLQNSTTRVKLGKNAREHILKNWTWERNTKKLEEYFQSII